MSDRGAASGQVRSGFLARVDRVRAHPVLPLGPSLHPMSAPRSARRPLRARALLAVVALAAVVAARAAASPPSIVTPPDFRDRLDRAVVVLAIDVESVELSGSALRFEHRIATVDVLDVPLDGPGAQLVSPGDTLPVDIGRANVGPGVDWRAGDRLLVELRPTGAPDVPWTAYPSDTITRGAGNTAFLGRRVREWDALRGERDDRRRAALAAAWFVRLCEHPEGVRLAVADLVGRRDGRPARADRHPDGFPRFDAEQRAELVRLTLADRGDPDPRSLRRRIELLEVLGRVDERVLAHAADELRRRLADGPGPPWPLARTIEEGRVHAAVLHDEGLHDLVDVLRRHHPSAAAVADAQLHLRHSGLPTGTPRARPPIEDEAAALLRALDD